MIDPYKGLYNLRWGKPFKLVKRTISNSQISNLEASRHQVPALESRVRAGHGDDLGLLDQQVVGTIRPTAQQLKRPEFLETENKQIRGEAMSAILICDTREVWMMANSRI